MAAVGQKPGTGCSIQELPWNPRPEHENSRADQNVEAAQQHVERRQRPKIDCRVEAIEQRSSKTESAGALAFFRVEKKVFKAEGPGAVYDLVRKSEIF
jgi:hypothetical protein